MTPNLHYLLGLLKILVLEIIKVLYILLLIKLFQAPRTPQVLDIGSIIGKKLFPMVSGIPTKFIIQFG